LAAQYPWTEYKNFVVQLCYEDACEPADFSHLQWLAGIVDALGIQAVGELTRQFDDATSVIAELRASQDRLQDELARSAAVIMERGAAHTRLEAQITRLQGLQEQNARLTERCAAMEQSMSWRVTRPMRRITRYLPRAMRRTLQFG
jgi:histidinol dehydrogenase